MGEYDDIINLPHHQSAKHKQMSRLNRAAQFAPFAALTGHGAAISETARLTDYLRSISDEDDEIELEEEIISILNEQIQIIYENISEKPFVEITYFVPDNRKSGGNYVTVSGNVRRIDDYNREIIFTDDLRIPIDEIYSINIIRDIPLSLV